MNYDNEYLQTILKSDREELIPSLKRASTEDLEGLQKVVRFKHIQANKVKDILISESNKGTITNQNADKFESLIADSYVYLQKLKEIDDIILEVLKTRHKH